MNRHRVTAVVLAAGDGTRMGSGGPKALVDLAGRPLLLWSIRTLASLDEVQSVYVAAPPLHLPAVTDVLAGVPKVEGVVPGGASRGASTLAVLDALPEEEGTVVVHDAARPATDPETIRAVITAAASSGAATVAIPAVDTILTVESARVAAVPDRATQWHAQTPQAFGLSLLRGAHRSAASEGVAYTDDTGLIAHYAPALEIAVVYGSPDNLKVTVPADLERAALVIERLGWTADGP